MKLKLTRVASTLLLLAGGLSAVTSLQSNSGGITGKSQVGCGGGGCHSSAATTVVGILGLPSGYTPGQTYSLTVNVASSNASHVAAGIDMTVSAGTLSNPGSGTTLNGTTELRHTTPKTMSSGAATFTFDWTAPAAGTGNVTFFMAGNAVNLNGGTSGDGYATATQPLSEGSSSTPPTVTTTAASAITQTTATLNGTVNANGGTYAAGFQYGLTTAYGTTVINPGIVSGTTTTAITGSAGTLSPNTLYHFRAAATDIPSFADTTFGADMTFTTLNSASVATVQSAGIRFYPNPATDRLAVDVRNTGMDVREVRVSDMTGRVLNVTSTTTAGGFEIQVASLPAGQYYLLVADRNGKLVASTFTKQ